MRLKLSTALLVLAMAIAGWPGMSRDCGMSCCAPTVVEEVQVTMEMPGCCCCSDGKGSCGWERATHQRTHLAAVSSEQHVKEYNPVRSVVMPAFLQVAAISDALFRGHFHLTPTGPPVPSNRTILLQVMLC